LIEHQLMRADAGSAADLTSRFDDDVHVCESRGDGKGFEGVRNRARRSSTRVANPLDPPWLSRIGEEIRLLHTVLAVAIGAGLGFGWHRFVGCRSGACPIWASPFASTAYGALLGLMLSR
jgi:hypothetical protein